MAKEFVKQITEYKKIYRDSKTGLAWLEDGTTGMRYSVHANIHNSGSVQGMKKLGYWGKSDRTVRACGYIYNIDTFIADTVQDQLVADECHCIACTARRERKGSKK